MFTYHKPLWQWGLGVDGHPKLHHLSDHTFYLKNYNILNKFTDLTLKTKASTNDNSFVDGICVQIDV